MVALRAPGGPQWVHEIKHDGYRLLVRKTSNRVRIYTRNGADWTKRFPAIIEAASKIKAASFYLDGEGVVCDVDGVAAFDKLHSKANDHSVFLYAFDLLEIDGEDLTPTPLEERKAPQGASAPQRRHRLQRTSKRRWRDDLSARVPAGLGGRGIEAPRLTVSVGAREELA
jgi:hypothetical protein